MFRLLLPVAPPPCSSPRSSPGRSLSAVMMMSVAVVSSSSSNSSNNSSLFGSFHCDSTSSWKDAPGRSCSPTHVPVARSCLAVPVSVFQSSAAAAQVDAFYIGQSDSISLCRVECNELTNKRPTNKPTCIRVPVLMSMFKP